MRKEQSEPDVQASSINKSWRVDQNGCERKQRSVESQVRRWRVKKETRATLKKKGKPIYAEILLLGKERSFICLFLCPLPRGIKKVFEDWRGRRVRRYVRLICGNICVELKVRTLETGRE